jgi:hypothetical protein
VKYYVQKKIGTRRREWLIVNELGGLVEEFTGTKRNAWLAFCRRAATVQFYNIPESAFTEPTEPWPEGCITCGKPQCHCSTCNNCGSPIDSCLCSEKRVTKCQHPDCEREDAVRHHQNTTFVDEERNWVTLCPPHAEENDEYWADMWSQYYQGVL